MTSTLREDQYTFFVISLSSSENKIYFKVLGKIKTHILCSKILFENLAVYEKMWKSIVELGMQQLKMSRMHNLCWITKGTNTQAAPITVVNAQLDLLYKCYIVRSFRQLRAEKIKHLFCTIVCTLMMGH